MPPEAPGQGGVPAKGGGIRPIRRAPVSFRVFGAGALLSAGLLLGCGDAALVAGDLPPGAAAAAAEQPPAVPPPAPPPVPAPEAGANRGHQRMLEVLQRIKDRTGDDHEFQGDARIRDLERQLASLPRQAPLEAKWRILHQLADRMVYYGREREGLDLFEEADRLLPQIEGKVLPPEIHEFLYRMATCWLRFAETENCCALHGPESCILPLQGSALHRRKEGSTRAMATLRRVLEAATPLTPIQLRSIWLLNMAAMTLGEYPDGVPEKWRIPSSAFEGEAPFPRFPNVAGKLGLDESNLAGSVAADDFDGDGNLDLFVSSWSTSGQLRFYRGRGDGTFEDRTKAAGLEGLYGGLNILHADYDNDGRLDLLVLRGAWLAAFGRHPLSLLRNNGDGTFTDRAYEAGLCEENLPRMTGVFSDLDLDGDLDLYLGNETDSGFHAPCQLFVNDGNGRFVDRGAQAGVTNDRFAKGVAAGDFDGDRLPDLYVSNFGQPNRLYRNLGNLKFEDVAGKLGVADPVSSFGCWFWDDQNDGNLDLMVFAFPALQEDYAASALGIGPPYSAGLPRLYRGDGKGGFRECGEASGLRKPVSPMGLSMGDFDNDGFTDFYLGTGRPQARDLIPNAAYHNLRGKGFADVTVPSGLGHLQKGHGIAFADMDGDGDLDIFAQMGGAYRADMFHNAVFENPGFGNHWISVGLRGTRSNRFGVGCRVRAEILEDGARRSVYGWVGAQGSFGSSPLRAHLGLGKAAKVEVLEVFWPVTGKTQVFRDLPADRLVDVTEDQAEPAVRGPVPTRLGGTPR